MAKQTLLSGSIHTGRPKDEEPHIKQYTKNKREITEYIVNVELSELGIDDNSFKELQTLFQMFDLDKDGVLAIAEFEKVLRALGRACKSKHFTFLNKQALRSPCELLRLGTGYWGTLQNFMQAKSCPNLSKALHAV